LLGLDVVSRMPGATFLSSGGYHHHLAANIWNSRGARVRSQRATGLANVELVADRVMLDAVRSRLSPEQRPKTARHIFR
jgi:catechol 2,3-dioxygenase